MFSFCIFLAFVSLATAQTCQFYGDDNKFYDLIPLSRHDGQKAYSYYEEFSKKRWYFNICGKVRDLVDENGAELEECTEDSSICFRDDESSSKYFSGGDKLTTLKVVPESIIKIGYSAGDRCYEDNTKDSYYKVSIQLNCDFESNESPIVIGINSSSPCNPIIVVNTTLACPAPIDQYTTFIPAIPRNATTTEHAPPVLVFGTIVFCFTACVGFCFYISKKRNLQLQHRRNFSIEMSHHQPIVENDATSSIEYGYPRYPTQYYPDDQTDEGPNSYSYSSSSSTPSSPSSYYFPGYHNFINSSSSPSNSYQPASNSFIPNNSSFSSDELFARKLQDSFDKERNLMY